MGTALQTTLRLIALQFIATLACATIFAYFQGWEGVKSAAMGGLIGTITTGYFALRFFTKLVPVAGGYAVKGLLATQVSKYVLIIALFYIALKVFQLQPAVLVVTFAATQVAYWLVLIFNPSR